MAKRACVPDLMFLTERPHILDGPWRNPACFVSWGFDADCRIDLDEAHLSGPRKQAPQGLQKTYGERGRVMAFIDAFLDHVLREAGQGCAGVFIQNPRHDPALLRFRGRTVGCPFGAFRGVTVPKPLQCAIVYFSASRPGSPSTRPCKRP